MPDFVQGIDVSHWQEPNIDWQKVKNAGYEFAFIKVTDGNAYKQAFINEAKIQEQGAIDACIKIGYYHFTHPASTPSVQDDASFEADFFLEILSIDFPKPNFSLVADFEDAAMRLSPKMLMNGYQFFSKKF